MSLRRGSLKLKALGRSHGSLQILLWQARETQSTLLAAAAAQKNLFSDIAAWASTENRALSDVCSSASELSSMYSGAIAQLAMAFKSFRKEMGLVLEGEKRCDNTQKRLQDAEQKRIKLRRQVLRAQNRTISEGTRQSGDFTQLQTQLAEAERTAERSHVEACEASREQEAVKLVVLKTALTKLSQSHLTLSSQVKVIFEGNYELSNLLPEPPPPGDPLSCIRYTSYDTSKAIIDRVKGQVNIDSSCGAGLNSSRRSSGGSTRPLSTSTPVTSPNSSMWSAEPSAPYSPPEPPPPYNTSYLSSSPHQVLATHSRNSSINISNPSPRRLTVNSHHVHSPNRSSANLENYCSSNSNNLSPNSSSVGNLTHHSYNSTGNCDAVEENRVSLYPNLHRNSSSRSVNGFGDPGLNDSHGRSGHQRHSYGYLPNNLN